MVREDYPLARKELNKCLKDKTLDITKKMPAIKLVYDKVHGDTGTSDKPATIQIEHLERMQVIMGK